MKAALAAALTLTVVAAAASQQPPETGVSARWPAGSITTEESAKTALSEARASREKLSAGYVERLQACKDELFPDYCRGKARSERDAGEAELARVEKEALGVVEKRQQPSAAVPAGQPPRTERPPELLDRSILERWPQGSIKSEEQAKAALEDVDTFRDKLKAAYRDEYNRCIGKVLVSKCWDEARLDQYNRNKELRQVELQAKDFLRAMTAEKERERKAAVIAKEEAGAGKPGPAAKSAEKAKQLAGRSASQPKEPKAVPSRAAGPKDDSARRAQAAERARSAERARGKVAENRAKAAQRARSDAENERAYLERRRKAEESRAIAEKNRIRSEQRRSERIEQAKKERELRIEAQKRADERRARAKSALNPFD